MKKILLLALIVLFGGCLKREPLSERDHGRTDSALVAIERLMDKILVEEEFKKTEEENKTKTNFIKRKIFPKSIEMVNTKKVDTLFLEKTITMVYTKDSFGELILDSVTIVNDSCFHFTGNNFETIQ